MNRKLEGCLDQKKVENILKDYHSNPVNKVVRHSLSRTTFNDAMFNSESLKDIDPTFSIDIETMKVTNQRSSGRCWIFAGCNVLRELVGKKLNIKFFELSENYISLYDKIEKSNFALESIIRIIDRDSYDRVFQFILRSPVNDGGQWDMFVNLVKKYGLMPKSAFPETFQSNNTAQSSFLVNQAIRNFAYEARKLFIAGKKEEIRPLKEKVMEKIYHLFLNAFGVPPKEFDFEYVDENNEYKVDKSLNPRSFFEKYVGIELLEEYQSITNAPTIDKPMMRNFTIDFLGNVVEGKNINHLNLSMERMKELIIAQLKEGLPVWFGADVSFYRDRSAFAWDDNAFDYEASTGFNAEFDKGAMLDFRASAMNHAMVITGVNLVDGEPAKWKIENSWGEDVGKKGYFVMSSSFFNKFVYQAVILKRFLSKEELEATKADPIVLPPWDPMGTLAD